MNIRMQLLVCDTQQLIFKHCSAALNPPVQQAAENDLVYYNTRYTYSMYLPRTEIFFKNKNN